MKQIGLAALGALVLFIVISTPAWSGGASESSTPTEEEIPTIEMFARAGPYKTGDHMDSPFFQELKKRFNVEFNVVPVTTDVFKEKFQVTIMSGDLPDFFSGAEVLGDAPYINQLQQEGEYFYPVNELYHLMPEIQELHRRYPYVREAFQAPDGNVYIIPGGFEEPVFYMGFQVRNDVLESVGFDIDTVETVEDYMDMFRALYEANDRQPIATSKPNHVARLLWTPMRWIGREKNKVYYDKDRDRFGYPYWGDSPKDIVQFFATMYEEGMLHPDSMTMTEREANKGLMSGKYLVNNTGSPMYWSEIVERAKDPSLEWDWVAPKWPTYNGKLYTQPVNLFKVEELLISAETDHAETIAEIADYFYSDEGRLLALYGIEGEQYALIDELPRLLYDVPGNLYQFPEDYELPRPLGTEEQYKQWRQDWGVVGGFSSLNEPMYRLSRANMLPPDAENKWETDWLRKMKPVFSDPPAPTVRFGEKEERMLTLQNALDTASFEAVAKMVIGVLEVDAGWEELQEQLEKIGVREYEEIWNEAYRKTKAGLQ